MTVIVKCDWHELGSDDVFTVDQVWIYNNCPLERGDEVFIWWHERSRQPTELEMRGTLSQFTRLGKSPTNNRPVVWLQIDVVQRITQNQRLTVDDLDENSDSPGERALWCKLKRNRWTKVAFLNTVETDYLRSFFDNGR
jgi:hypothetical protein